MKLSIWIIFFLAMFLTTLKSYKVLSQNHICVQTNGNINDAIDINLNWFKQLSENYNESTFVVYYGLGSHSYHFTVSDNDFVKENSDYSDNNDYQFGQGSVLMDNGRKLDVKYLYNKEKFKVELARYLKNGELDTSFFKNGRITKTVYKKDKKGSMIVFKSDENLVIAGYTESDSTFIYIK